MSHQNITDYFPGKPEQSEYLVNCLNRYKVVYVETPKVACSTIKRVLQLLETDGDESKIPESVHDRMHSPLAMPSKIGCSLPELLTGPEFFRFSYVRNPFSRALSTYLDKVVNNEAERRRLLPELEIDPENIPSFEEFLHKVQLQKPYNRDIHWSTQYYLLQPKKVTYSFIGRFETFAVTWPLVLNKIAPQQFGKYQKITVQHHRSDANNLASTYLNPFVIKLILDIYAEDFDEFRFCRDPYFLAA